MARTVLTAQATPGASGPAATTGTILTFTAADVANLNAVALTGKQLLLACNTSTTTDYHVTVTSVTDPQGRTGDITTFAVTHNADISQAIAMFGPFPVTGWQQSASGQLFFQADNTAIKFAVITLP